MPGKLSFVSDKIRSISDPQLDVIKVKSSDYEPIEVTEDMSETEMKNTWFKTWPERHYDKLEQSSEQSPEDESDPPDVNLEKSPVPLNKILENMPLAYSPVTKQLHFLNLKEQKNLGIAFPKSNDKETDDEFDEFRTTKSSESADAVSGKYGEKSKTPPVLMLDLSQNLGKDLVLRSCLKRLELSTEEKFGCLWSSKIGYSDPRSIDVTDGSALKSDGCALRTEASSFSSIVSSLSDGSPSNLDETSSGKLAFFENDDLSVRSHCSHDSGSNYGESSKFFEEKAPGHDKCDVKRKGLSAFFSRNVFSWKSAASASQGWKLFGKNASQECRDSETPNFSSNDILRSSERSLNNSPICGKKYEDVVASSTALILHNRPANLPAKSIDEEQKHRLEYQQIVEAARRKELKETKMRKKQLQQQLKLEEQLANASRLWNNEILPKWELMKNSKKARELWWSGIPPCVRGKVWKLAIGNELNITNQLYEICLARAQERLKAVDTNTSEETSDNADKESSVELIQLDISRTFPHLCIFQKGGPYYDILHCLIGAYVCYRPDVGYVQGMSFIAAILILNLEAADAFISFSNLLNRPCHMAFFSLNQPLMQAYYDTYNDFFRENLPRLCQHFEESSVTTDLYLLDWVYSVFAKAMPLDVVCRVWDVYLRDGEEFLFRTALGILHLHRDKLMKLDFINASQFLTKLPEDLSPDLLFRSIDTIKMNVGKQKFGQVLATHVERYSSR